jgi:hypothetical protein
MAAALARNLEAMLADDLEAQLGALEEAAPLTEEIDEGAAVEEIVEDKPVVEEKPVTEARKPLKPEEYEQRHEQTTAALRQEREQRRQEAQRAEAAIAEQRRMEAAWQEMQQRILAQQLSAKGPDPYDDPEGARAFQQQQQQRLQQFHAQQAAQQQQEFQQRQQVEAQNRIFNGVEDLEAEFKASNPDYDEATDHLLGVQESILINAGYAPEAARQAVADWSLNVAATALQNKRNPAKVAYDMARQAGYVPKAQQQQSAAAEKLAAIQAGQKSAQTLSGGGSGAGESLSLKAIAGLKGAAFDAAMDKFLRS